MSAGDQLLIIVNPESGNKQAVIDIAAYVLPLLRDIPYTVRTTEHLNHAGEIAIEFLQSGNGNAILVAGGDGTIHEIVNALASGIDASIGLVLWPGGTANALYSSIYSSTDPNPVHAHILPPESDDQIAYKLKSVLAYIHSRTSPSSPSRSLAVTHTRIYDAQGAPVETIAGVVVASTALHAAILRTADQLRSEVAGVARFQEAARRNMTVWSSSDVRLFGPDGKTSEGVRYYDVESDAIIHIPGDGANHVLEGPFFYFLSTVNVDRLEPTFYITAPFTTHPPLGETKTMDIVILRPGRDPKSSSQYLETEAARGQYAMEMGSKMFPAAYNKGTHVKLQYPGSAEGEEGPTIVEYYRASGWEWTPRGDDEPSRLVCVDGTVLTIPMGGKVRCQVVQHDNPIEGVRNVKATIFI